MKMANMDSAFDFMFTSPKDDKGVSFIFLNLVFNTLIGAKVMGGGGGGGGVGAGQSLSTVAGGPNLRRAVKYCQLDSSHIPLLSIGKPEV